MLFDLTRLVAHGRLARRLDRTRLYRQVSRRHARPGGIRQCRSLVRPFFCSFCCLRRLHRVLRRIGGISLHADRLGFCLVHRDDRSSMPVGGGQRELVECLSQAHASCCRCVG